MSTMPATPSPRPAAWRCLYALQRLLDGAARTGTLLALPLLLLLFAQWPLRDLLARYSREANDLAQCLFALYVALALHHAGRHGAHLAVDLLARRAAPWARAVRRWVAPALLLPWALFVLWAGWPLLAQSVLQRELFSETGTPGYFVVKLAMGLLALLLALQALLDLLLGPTRPDGPAT